MSDDPGSSPKPLSPFETGMRAKCPRCGSGDLFDGFLQISHSCKACDLDYGFADAGDGPAFFVMSFAGFFAFGFVLWMEFSVGASYWLNALITIPLVLAVSILPLRPLKGLMIAQQYGRNAHEGALDDDADGKVE
ncbi:MAG: DUF983 domain-containing protein [Pseudomonadota bacterium]